MSKESIVNQDNLYSLDDSKVVSVKYIFRPVDMVLFVDTIVCIDHCVNIVKRSLVGIEVMMLDSMVSRNSTYKRSVVRSLMWKKQQCYVIVFS